MVRLSCGVQSQSQKLTRGIPQGSILGPLLYLIYANDLANNIGNGNTVHTVCYADDTNILITANTTEEAVSRVIEVYKKIEAWAVENDLRINRDKTATLVFSLTTTGTDIVDIGGICVKPTTRFLGVTLDSSLRWVPHINELSNKLRSQCYGLRTLRNICNKDALLALYHACFHSRLRYGIACWGTAPDVSRVFIIQKYAVRIIANLGPLESCRESFRRLGILTAYSTYIYEVCCVVHNNRHDFTLHQVDHSYSTRFKDRLLPASHTTSLYQRGIFYNACRLYNSLPGSMKSLTISRFKKELKKQLILKACYSYEEFFNS